MSTSTDTQPLIAYPLYHRAPLKGAVGHEVRDAHGRVVAMMTFHPDEQVRAQDLAKLVAARLNRAEVAASAATAAVQDDLWHLINNAMTSAALHDESQEEAANRVRKSIGSYFAVERDPPLNVVDPEVTALADALSALAREFENDGFVGEQCELDQAAAHLRTFNSPNLVLNEFTRNRFRRRVGMVNETCQYLTRMASDPKRAGEHVNTLRTAVATIYRLLDDVTAPAARTPAQSIAA